MWVQISQEHCSIDKKYHAIVPNGDRLMASDTEHLGFPGMTIAMPTV